MLQRGGDLYEVYIRYKKIIVARAVQKVIRMLVQYEHKMFKVVTLHGGM